MLCWYSPDMMLAREGQQTGVVTCDVVFCKKLLNQNAMGIVVTHTQTGLGQSALLPGLFWLHCRGWHASGHLFYCQCWGQ